MPLDLFQADQNAAMASAAHRLAPDMPATFEEAFGPSYQSGVLFGQSMANVNARVAALDDYADEVSRKTGEPFQIPTFEGLPDLDALNHQIATINGSRPDLRLEPLTSEALTERAVQKSRAARQAATAMAAREKTTGGTIGGVLGSVASAATDPINVIAFPLAAPPSLGIVGTALAWSAIAGGTQAAIEAVGAPFRERVEPGYFASGEPVRNVVGATLTGGAIGGGFKGLARGWDAIRGRPWSTTIRDAGHVVESEANLADSNPLPGIEGETAHRAAMSKTIDDLAAGRPPDVSEIITPELQQAYQARFSHIDEARQLAAETKAPEDIGDVAFELQGLARGAGHSLPRQEADQLAARLIEMPDEQARATLDEFMIRPRTLVDTLPERTGEDVFGARSLAPAPPPEATASLSTDLTPSRVEAIRADKSGELADTVSRDFDRLRAEKGDNYAVPIGEMIDAQGQRAAAARTLGEVSDEIDARIAAAREIALCAGPQPDAGAL